MSQVPDEGFLLNPTKRGKVQTKDIKPELFWPVFQTINKVAQMESMNPTWGPKLILKVFQDSRANVLITERQVKKYISLYFYDDRTEELYYMSTDLSTGHHICVERDRLVLEANRDHHKDHRGADTIYESLRKKFFQGLGTLSESFLKMR